MKKNLFSIIIATGIFVNVQAQTDRKAAFQISYPDRSTHSFFEEHPDLNYITIRYENDTAVSLKLSFYQTTGTVNDERYYLSFEGDRYLFHKKYKELSLPKPAKLTMEYLAGFGKLRDSSTYYDLAIILRRDSIIHDFNFYTIVVNNLYRPVKDLNRAKLLIGVGQLQKKLTQNFKKWKPITVPDSVLVITGIVESDGSLGNLGLKSGNPSSFSKKVLEFIGQEAVSWSPAWQTKPVRYQVKFFVRLNRDESITFSVL